MYTIFMLNETTMTTRAQELQLNLNTLYNFIREMTEMTDSLVRQGELDKAANVENNMKRYQEQIDSYMAEYVALIRA